MNAISPTRQENFPNWYLEVIKPLAQHGAVKGTQVIKPWGYGVWELIQQSLDQRIKQHGVENFYAPLFVGLDAIQAEANHIDGFAKECAVVTHSRLTMQEGKLVADGALADPVIIRPTSEAIIGPIVKDWVASYRDMPLKLNQWANVVRWEMRTRLFLRSSEFLWQEGHTFHASAQEANEMAKTMLTCYQVFFKEMLALAVVSGEKSVLERFSGANHTYTIELLMQDGKALQGGTSHDLGQNFAKAYDISFSNQEGALEHAYGTSWGVTTRMIGAIAMVHGDDDGLCLPPRVATTQVVILPINPKDDPSVAQEIEQIASTLSSLRYMDQPLRVKVDQRAIRGGAKAWDWVKKGVPIRIEIGPRDIEKQQVCLSRRDMPYGEKQFIAIDQLPTVLKMLDEIHENMYRKSQAFIDDNTIEVSSLDALLSHFDQGGVGFVKVPYCGDADHEATLSQHKVSIRCLLEGDSAKCVFTNQDTTQVALIAKAY